MGMSLGRKQPGNKQKGFGPNSNTIQSSGIKKGGPFGFALRSGKLAKSTDNSIKGSQITLRRNSVSVGRPATGTEQTVGIKAKLHNPGVSARVANSGPQRNPRTRMDVAVAPPTAGLKGAPKNGLMGTAKRSVIARGTSPKGSMETHRTNGQSGTTVGLKGARVNGLSAVRSTLQKSPTLGSTRGIKKTTSANRGGIKSTGTIGKVKAGGLGIPNKTGVRVRTSTLPVQKVNSATIPAAVRAAARRAPAASNPGAGRKTSNVIGKSAYTQQNSAYAQQRKGGGKFAL